MAWTAPITFVPDTALTAAHLNLYLRDNMLETEAAKSTTAGAYHIVSGPNRIEERIGQRQTMTDDLTTDSTDYTDLSVVGPTITVTHSSRVLVFMSANMWNTANAMSRMAVELSGEANSIEPSDDYCIGSSNSSNNTMQFSGAFLFDDLTPGTTTFTAKYRISGAGTGHFDSRRLVVFPY